MTRLGSGISPFSLCTEVQTAACRPLFLALLSPCVCVANLPAPPGFEDTGMPVHA